jgi:GTP cyclohydrolase I
LLLKMFRTPRITKLFASSKRCFSRKDPLLGLRIQEQLVNRGLNSPYLPNERSTDEKVKIIAKHFREIMLTLGLDLSDDSLEGTPNRVAKMYVSEIFEGLEADKFPACTAVANKMGYDEMILNCNIQLQSFCEHHFVPFVGKAHIAYIPCRKVLGLSKMNRVVRYFSKRPQIQERLTEQIWQAMSLIVESETVGVVLEAKHFCVQCRGIEDINSITKTHKVGGHFRDDPKTRQEFFGSIPKTSFNSRDC